MRARDAAREFFGCDDDQHTVDCSPWGPFGDQFGCEQMALALLRAAAGERERALKVVRDFADLAESREAPPPVPSHIVLRKAAQLIEAMPKESAIRQLPEEE